MVVKTVGFDFFGTLVDAKAKRRACTSLMCQHLQECGYNISCDEFIANYQAVAVEHWRTRRQTLREINNSFWLVDALNRMGIKAEASSPDIVSAVEKYFSLWRLTFVSDAPAVIKRLSGAFKIALVSNFTDSAFLRRSLKNLGIEKFFDHVIDSDKLGYRKPHPKIFNRFLKLTRTKAEDSVFIGDDYEADIKGAKGVGIKSVLLVRPGRVRNQHHIDGFPDYTVSSLTEFEELLGKI